MPGADANDTADVAVAALIRPQLRNRLFAVTGPRLLTFAECVAANSAAVGYPTHHTQLPIASFIQVAREHGEPEDRQSLLRDLLTVVFDGRNGEPMVDVEAALGPPAGDFEKQSKQRVRPYNRHQDLK